MLARLAVYNRTAAISLPIITFATCCVSLLVCGLSGGFFRATSLTWGFGYERGFPVIACVGAVVGLSDWAFPAKRKVFFVVTISLSILAAILGWALAAFILEL